MEKIEIIREVEATDNYIATVFRGETALCTVNAVEMIPNYSTDALTEMLTGWGLTADEAADVIEAMTDWYNA